MIESIEVTNYRGESIELPLRSPEESGFFVLGIDGLGPAKGTVNITEGLSVDGGIYNSSRKTFRNIVLYLAFRNSSGETIEYVRHNSYQYFPVKRNLTIKITTDLRVVYAEGYVETNEVNIFSKRQATTISIICPDANLYSGETIETVFSGIQGTFEFPFSNESLTEMLIKFGDVVLSQQKNLSYSGDEETGVIVKAWFSGTVVDYQVYNLTAQQALYFDDDKIQDILGSSLSDGDYLEINTNKRVKSAIVIRDGVEYNVLNAIDYTVNGHAWFTIDPGDNVFYITASSGSDYIQSQIDYSPAYIGV